MNAPEHSHTITWSTPVLDPAEVRAMTGLEYLRHALGQGLRPPPMAVLMNLGASRFEHGLAVLEATPAEYHYNMLGTVHGGFAATLIDSALGGAVHSTLAPGFGYSTLDLKVSFVRAITVQTGTVTCEGRVIHVGSRIATAEARLVDAAGKLYAHGTATCMIMPLKEGN